MNKLIKMILALLAKAAVLGYTYYNYVTGERDLTFLIVCMAILGFPFVNILNLLIREIKNDIKGIAAIAQLSLLFIWE